jgi:parallel beta-helix repeat protein
MRPATVFTIALLLLAPRAFAGPITVSNANDSGIGSLRDAINNANAAPDFNDIVFSIPGPGPWTIHLLSPLPAITSDLSIEGSTASGYVANTAHAGLPMNGTLRIELDGTSAGANATCLTFNVGSSVDGVVINNFSGAPAITVNASNASINRCYLGTDLTGLIARPNNVGVLLSGGSGALVTGCLISGNHKRGIEISGYSQSTITGNYIGTDKTGASTLGNGDSGIQIHNASTGITVGVQPGSNCTLPTSGPNVIAFNASDGVEISGLGTTGNKVASNVIFSNDGLGIDIDADGVTANDNLDADGGANLRQNFPVLVSVVGNTIYGNLKSAASSSYAVQFFWSPACDPAGNGEGKQYLGYAGAVNTDATGLAVFTFTCGAIPAGGVLTALATDVNGNTSEFSKCMTSPPTAVGAAPPAFALGANVPNPFNPATIIPYRVNAASRVHIAIYDLHGALVKTLVDGMRSAGAWSITWNGEDEHGARVASGVYFCRMRAGSFDETRKMVLLK